MPATLFGATPLATPDLSGGAIATQLCVDNPLVSHVLFPIYAAAFVWGGLYLRDARARALLRRAR